MGNKLKILLLLLLFVLTTFSQDVVSFESPYSKIYTRDDYNAHDQNWNITQDSLGLIYVANNEALLIYDGEVWQNIKMNNVWGLRANKKGTVYFGADNILGKIEYGARGDIILKSFVGQLNVDDRNIGIIQDILFNGDTTYFMSFNAIYVFVNDNFKKIIRNEGRFMYNFIFRNKMYFTDKNDGINVVENNEIISIPIINEKFGNAIYNIFEFENKTILLTETGLFYTKDRDLDLLNGNFYNLDTAFSKQISKGNARKCILLSDSRIALSSLTNGIVIYNLKTAEKIYLNKENVLSTNSVLNIFEDKYKNLWISTYEGINFVEISYPVRIISEKAFTANIITSINKINNDIYFTTLTGIYKIRKEEKTNQIFIHDLKINSGFTGIINYNNHLYITSTSGLNEITNDSLLLIKAFNIPYILRKIKKYPNYFIIGGGSGLSIMKYKKGKVEEIHNLKSYNVDTRYIAEHNGYLWFSLRKGIVSRIKLKDIFNDSLDVQDYFITDSTNTNTVYINIINDKLIVQDDKIIKEFNYNKNKFESSAFADNINKLGVFEMSIKDDNSDWVSNFNILKNLTFKKDTFYDNYTFLKRLNNIKTSSFYFDTMNNELWIGGTNKIGVIHKDLIDTSIQEYNVLIRRILVNDSTIFYGYNLNDSLQNIFQRKSKFLFNFAALFYQANEENKYSYILEGYDNNWSDWSDINFANYTNLEYGTYTFKVKAINVFGKESKIAQYTFEVEPAFYQMWYAHVMFILIFVLIVIFAIYLNGKRLKAINLKLEKTIEERTIEITEKNKELEKLSIVASETDNSVMIYNENYILEWVNEGEIRNFGYTLEEIYETFGKTITELSFYPKIHEVVKEIEETKKSVHYNSKGTRKDGSEIWSRTTLTPILDENKKIVKIIAIDSDITELKHAEEKITAQNILITHSLEYAKKIQDAVLPSLSSLKNEFKDAFILFKPKDIVSGDFFWMHKIGSKVIVATADCTGHGVPGGFMSMIGNTLMNEIVKEKQITSPSYILSLMDEKINDLFSSSESGQADGMDVAIALIDKKEGIIEMASANQSMYVVDDDEVFEFEGDIWSIGGVFSKKATGNFKSKIFNITEHTTLYMSSDGYQDQFGGKQDTKILKPKFVELLKDNSENKLEEQGVILEAYLNKWIGGGKQTDDILVIGIKM